MLGLVIREFLSEKEIAQLSVEFLYRAVSEGYLA